MVPGHSEMGSGTCGLGPPASGPVSAAPSPWGPGPCSASVPHLLSEEPVDLGPPGLGLGAEWLCRGTQGQGVDGPSLGLTCGLPVQDPQALQCDFIVLVQPGDLLAEAFNPFTLSKMSRMLGSESAVARALSISSHLISSCDIWKMITILRRSRGTLHFSRFLEVLATAIILFQVRGCGFLDHQGGRLGCRPSPSSGVLAAPLPHLH